MLLLKYPKHIPSNPQRLSIHIPIKYYRYPKTHPSPPSAWPQPHTLFTLNCTCTSQTTLTQFGSLFLPLQFKLLQHLLLFLGLSLQPQVRTDVYGFVMGSLKGSRCLVTTKHHLGDIVANTLGSGIELRVAVHTVEVVGLLNELLIAACGVCGGGGGVCVWGGGGVCVCGEGVVRVCGGKGLSVWKSSLKHASQLKVI